MTNLERAKLKLKEAETVTEREYAIQFAMDHGMALQDIEQYLDWVDFIHRPVCEPDAGMNNLEPDEEPNCDK